MLVSTLLPGSLCTLAAGPLLSRFARSRPRVIAFVDGFIVVSIGGLVLFDVVPHALGRSDIVAIACMALGYLVPGMAERVLRYGVHQTHAVIFGLALLGVAAHSMLDGSALAQSATQEGSLLGYGVLLHQIPVGLMVWWVLRDRPLVIPWLVLLFMAAMTVFGYLVEPAILSLLPERAALWFEALVGGSLLHVIGHAVHDHDHEHELHGDHDHWHDRVGAGSAGDGGESVLQMAGNGTVNTACLAWVSAAGGGSLLGLAVLVALQFLEGGAYDAGMMQMVEVLWSLTRASAPAMLVAYGAITLLGALAFARRGSAVGGSPVDTSVRASHYGRSDGGEMSLEATLLAVSLLGLALAIVRLVVARPLASLVRSLPALTGSGASQAQSGEVGLELAIVAAVERSAPWLSVGLIVAAAVSPLLSGSWLTGLSGWSQVVLLALMGWLIPAHAVGLMPLGAVLMAADVSSGAVLALIMAGPLPGIHHWLQQARESDRVLSAGGGGRDALRSIVALVSAIAAGLAFNLLGERFRAGAWTGAATTPSSGFTTLAAVLLVLLMILVLARRGVRDFLEPFRKT